MSIKQPEGITRALLPHQLKNIYRMEKIEKKMKINVSGIKYINTNIGILGDKPGYGKSMCIIGLICRDRNNGSQEMISIDKKGEANGYISIFFRIQYLFVNCTVILCPKNIINQWQKEFLYSDLRVCTIIKKVEIFNCEPTNFDVILVSPGMYNNFISKFENYCWKRFVYDEPTCIRISSMKHIESKFIWFISGTYEDIKDFHSNCKTFIKDIVNMYRWYDMILENIVVKNSEEDIENSFKIPEIIIKNYTCYNKTYSLLNNCTSNIIKNMLDAGNIRESIQIIGGKETDNLFEALLNEKRIQIEKYNKKIIISKISHTNTEKYEKKLEILQNDISNIEKKYKEMLKSNCIICYDNLCKPVLETNCGNLFCGECLLNWIKDKYTCPLCRVVINPEKLLYINSKEDKNTKLNTDKIKDKPEVLLEIIVKNGKFLIFSEWDATFEKITNLLTENSFKYIILSKRNTEKDLNLFKNSQDINILFVNCTYNGAGLNIEFATDIIFYHRLRSTVENQAIGRANRIGRKTPLTIHYLNY